MKPDDLLYGSRSGIQKAIRRGDLDLAKTCFDLLWSEKEHKNWLKWRMAVLVEEEAWHLLGEWAEFIKDKPTEESDWRKFVYRLTVATKSKDAGALWSVANRMKDGDELEEQPEFVTMREYQRRITDGDPGSVADELYEEMVEGRTTYEAGGLRSMRLRVNQGGMLADRFCCLAAMVLIGKRGLSKKLAVEDMRAGMQKWWNRVGEKRKPRTVNLPWYVFDMHTQVGKIVKGIWCRKYLDDYEKLTEQKFANIWFVFASAAMPRDLVNYIEKTEQLLPDETAWWVRNLKEEIQFADWTAKQIARIWRKEMRDDVKGLVEWLLRKREEGK